MLVPSAPPVSVPVYGGFDYVTVDAAHRRVIAAHTGSRALLIVDADSGKVVGQVRVGGLHGVAYDPQSGTIFTGNGNDRSVSEIDPQSLKVTATADVPGEVDAIAYDSSLHRLYADEEDGTSVYVVDTTAMKQIGTVSLPGHKPEYLAVDPTTHDVYQNISDQNEFTIIDHAKLAVRSIIKTPEVEKNHPLQYDAGLQRIMVAGQNGVLALYDTSGKLTARTTIQPHVDQCDIDSSRHLLACAGGGSLSLVDVARAGGPAVIDQVSVPRGVHTVGIDGQTGRIWVVWSSTAGDFVQSYHLASGNGE